MRAPDRPCPGCRSLDGEHDFGPTCTLADEDVLREAREVLEQKYCQTSRAYRHVARLPEGKTGVQALAEASGDAAWSDRLGERSAGDYYLRVYAEKVTLSPEVFEMFRRLGGGTYDTVAPVSLSEHARHKEIELEALRARCFKLEAELRERASCSHKEAIQIGRCISWCQSCGAWNDTDLTDGWHLPARSEAVPSVQNFYPRT